VNRFAADWLAVREQADAASRAPELLRPLQTVLRSASSSRGPLQIIDLATGTGANLRYLAPRLGGNQIWTVVDTDPDLLAELPLRVTRWAGTAGLGVTAGPDGLTLEGPTLRCEIRIRRLHLDTQLAKVPFAGAHLVTASALLDLVSRSWLERLLAQCHPHGAAFLFCMSYDGRIAWRPRERADLATRMLVNRHQCADKGLGPALGPGGANTAARLLRSSGYEVLRARSDWRLGPGMAALQSALLQGRHAAALAMAPASARVLSIWRARRQTHIARGRSRAVVGHVDLVAWPI
jgi:hypothetical protein